MKSKLARQILCIVSGLFVTSLLVQGQTDRFADRTTIGFWEVGPGVMLAPGIEVRQNGIGGRIIKGDAAFIGGTFSGGALLKGRHKLQLTTGYFYAADDVRGDDIEPNIEQRIQIIPVLGEYHYVFDLNERISLRGGALLGVSAINLIYTNTGLDPLPDEKKRFEFAVSYGASVGMNVRLTGDIHLDFGYKYIATGKTSFRPHNNTTGVEYKMDSLGGHLFSAALQLRF